MIDVTLVQIGCQYKFNWLPGKTSFRNDLSYVKWDTATNATQFWVSTMENSEMRITLNFDEELSRLTRRH